MLFADLFSQAAGLPGAATTLFTRDGCQLSDPTCDAPLSFEVEAVAQNGTTSFVAGAATAMPPPAPPWLTQPLPIDKGGWGFIGATQGNVPAWARTLGDRFIRRVTDIHVMGNSLLAVALGSVSATSDEADSPPVLWLLKLDLAGNILRARSFLTSDGFGMPRIVVTAAGTVVVGSYAVISTSQGKSFRPPDRQIPLFWLYLMPILHHAGRFLWVAILRRLEDTRGWQWLTAMLWWLAEPA